MIRGKIYLLIETISFISMIFCIYNSDVFYDYIGYGVWFTSIISMLLMYKTRKKMLNNYKSGYPKNSYKNVIFNVFMTKKEQDLKLRTDWILDIDKVKKKLNVK